MKKTASIFQISITNHSKNTWNNFNVWK